MFREAYSRAKREDFRARLGGKPNDLLPFEALQAILQTYQQIPLREVQTIPLDKIVGSVGRYRDFTRDFLPRNSALADRWMRVETAMSSLEGVPPIEVFKVGEVYFVADGNHRVSAARANGFDSVDAYVTEIPVDPGIEPGDTLDQAIIKAGRARFLVETRLDRHFEGPDIYFTKPGGFTQVLRHIEAQRALLNKVGQIGNLPYSLEDAAVDWYIHVYQPIVTAIRDRQLLRHFPNRTAADLYIWIWKTIEEMHRQCGEEVSPDEAAALLEIRAQETSSPSLFQQAVGDLMHRIGDLSHAFIGGTAETPAWAEPILEWSDAPDLPIGTTLPCQTI